MLIINYKTIYQYISSLIFRIENYIELFDLLLYNLILCFIIRHLQHYPLFK